MEQARQERNRIASTRAGEQHELPAETNLAGDSRILVLGPRPLPEIAVTPAAADGLDAAIPDQTEQEDASSERIEALEQEVSALRVDLAAAQATRDAYSAELSRYRELEHEAAAVVLPLLTIIQRAQESARHAQAEVGRLQQEMSETAAWRATERIEQERRHGEQLLRLEQKAGELKAELAASETREAELRADINRAHQAIEGLQKELAEARRPWWRRGSR